MTIGIAKAVGIAQATYCNIENGKGAPSVDSAKKIGRVLGINWWLLFEDEVELTPDEERFIEDFRMASAEEQAAVRRLEKKAPPQAAGQSQDAAGVYPP